MNVFGTFRDSDSHRRATRSTPSKREHNLELPREENIFCVLLANSNSCRSFAPFHPIVLHETPDPWKTFSTTQNLSPTRSALHSKVIPYITQAQRECRTLNTVSVDHVVVNSSSLHPTPTQPSDPPQGGYGSGLVVVGVIVVGTRYTHRRDTNDLTLGLSLPKSLQIHRREHSPEKRRPRHLQHFPNH